MKYFEIINETSGEIFVSYGRTSAAALFRAYADMIDLDYDHDAVIAAKFTITEISHQDYMRRSNQ